MKRLLSSLILTLGFLLLTSAGFAQKAKPESLQSWRDARFGMFIHWGPVSLTEKELRSLDRIATMYLDYAEDQAERGIPMTMQDWADKLNAFLRFNERDLLEHPGKVTAEVAKAFAESEFEKYRVVQDRRFESDFDRAIKQLPKKGGQS